MVYTAVLGCGRQTRVSLTEELRSPAEDQDIRKIRQTDKAQGEEQDKRRVVDERRLEAERKRIAEEAELRRQQEISDRERLDREDKESEAKKKADASEVAFRAFESVPDCQTIPLAQTRTEKCLCPFNADSLIDPACDLATVDAETIRMLIEHDPATDEAPFAWTVTGKRFDSISGMWGDPVVVCRLVVREGSLCIEWPNTEISDEHELFRAVENSMLIVSCRNATGDSKILRQIVLREPIDLASANNATITLDPLAEKGALTLDSRLTERLTDVPQFALTWTIELTHPKWLAPQQLSAPDTAVAVVLPSAGLPGIEVGYQDIDPKGGGLGRLFGNLRVEATLRFSPKEAALSLNDQKVTGLDNVPLLRPTITIAALRDTFRNQGGPDQFERSLQSMLDNRLKTTGNESKAVVAALESNRDWFELITVKIKSMHVAARDSKGRVFAIPIVKPQEE